MLSVCFIANVVGEFDRWRHAITFIAALAEHCVVLPGTPEYLAPEVVTGKPHDYTVDVWSLGIMTYEMIVGASPFAAETEKATFTRIAEAEVVYPVGLMSPEAQDLIACLLEKDPGEF